MFWRSLIGSLLFASVAHAGFEVEVDPIAYLSKGYSGHLIYDTGIGIHVDFGAFGMTMPEFAEPNDGFRTSFTGYGIKFNYHGATPDGAFAGVSYGTSRFRVEQDGTGSTQDTDVQSVGVQFGYRFGNDGFYVAPWIGFDKVLNRPKLDFSGKVYEFPEVSVFPTVHLGYRF